MLFEKPKEVSNYFFFNKRLTEPIFAMPVITPMVGW